jgi:hypothetical protein
VTRRDAIASAQGTPINQTIERNRAWLQNWLRGVDERTARLGCTWTFPGLENGDALAAEFIEWVRALVSSPAEIENRGK